MGNCKRLELSLADVLSGKIKNKENFSISAQSRFGTNTNEVFRFDLVRKIIYLDYSRKNNYDQTVWFHETRQFKRFSMVLDIQNNIKLNVVLVPETPKREQTATTLHFDFISTGIVEKVV